MKTSPSVIDFKYSVNQSWSTLVDQTLVNLWSTFNFGQLWLTEYVGSVKDLINEIYRKNRNVTRLITA